MRTAERRILIIFCYYVLLGVIALTAFTYSIVNSNTLLDEYKKYFLCESKGIDSNNPEGCDRSGFENNKIPALTILSYILLGIFPAVNLIYAVNATELKQFCGRFKMVRFSTSTADQPSFSSDATAVSTVKKAE